MRSLIVAHDLTDLSANALGRGIRLAARHGAALHVVHVVPDDDEPGAAEAARGRLAAETRIMAEELTGSAPDLSVTVLAGDPAEAIGREAGRVGADLVLLGAHGEPRLRDVLFRTTAMSLAHAGAHPVLVVQTAHHAPYDKVMIAVEGESSARATLRAAGTLAPDAELFSVHAFEPTVAETLFRPRTVQARQSERERALEALADRLLPTGCARHHRAIARDGEVMEVLMKTWLELMPTLLVMGTQRRRGLVRLLAGNLTDPVLLACTSDILLVPMD